MTLEINKTEWFDATTKPSFSGRYEVRSAAGEERLLSYRAKGWAGSDFTHWRGVDVGLHRPDYHRLKEDLHLLLQGGGDWESIRGLAIRLARYLVALDIVSPLEKKDGKARGHSMRVAYYLQIAWRCGGKLPMAESRALKRALRKIGPAKVASLHLQIGRLNLPPLGSLGS